MKKLLDHLSGVSLVLAGLFIGGFAFYGHEAAWTYEEVLRQEELDQINRWNAMNAVERKQELLRQQARASR